MNLECGIVNQKNSFFLIRLGSNSGSNSFKIATIWSKNWNHNSSGIGIVSALDLARVWPSPRMPFSCYKKFGHEEERDKEAIRRSRGRRTEKPLTEFISGDTLEFKSILQQVNLLLIFPFLTLEIAKDCKGYRN